MTADTQPQPAATDPAPQTTPLYQDGRYTKFYLTMLILSTIGTALGLFGLFTVPQSLNELNTNPALSIVSLFESLVILPVAIVALVLLWKKKLLGLWLKLGTYAASLLSVAVSLFFINDILKQSIDIAVKDIPANDTSREFITSFTTTALYGSLILTVVISLTFSLLWWFAWKNQVAADAQK